MSLSGNDIREQFIEFFQEKHGHAFVPSSSLLPASDPTLLFANAGMNQFKDIFLGRETPDCPRAVNSQKCIRAGGKHNDLEDVGHDTYHHTFFEMLGNWSFGNYFKREAIQWAWELLTGQWGLPKDRLHVTVFEGDEADGLEPDEEARQLWQEVTDVDPAHIHLGNKKDNFWEMGETGPCGPCSEIHIDLTDDGSGGGLVNADDPRVIEIWNLVFIQFNRDESGKLSPLPATHVDTGMGLERVAMVLQGKRSNYATDLFVPIIEKIETLTDHRYGALSKLDDRFDVMGEDDMGDVACRVLADHARTLTFAIADGVIPSNEGRGYVLRRILRRACRYGRQYLNISGNFLASLVDTVVEQMGGAFPEVVDRRDYVVQTVAEEEESFGKTLDRGIEMFQKEAERLAGAGKAELPGDVAFDLYATYGFPVDLTEIMAREVGMTVDHGGYEQAMEAHRAASQGEGASFRSDAIVAELPATDDAAKYDTGPVPATVQGWIADGRWVTEGQLPCGAEAAVVLDKTNFYGEQGGQVGDTGMLSWPGGAFEVTDSTRAGQAVLHRGKVAEGTLTVGQAVTAKVDPRLDTMRNHTATHLLNGALRQVLGENANQAGSVVAPDRLRFDFTHNQALTGEQLAEVERLVNERVLADEPVGAALMPLKQAQEIPGVRAMFGEKYPDPVRVVTVGLADPNEAAKSPEGAFSVEFCGGTHLRRTGTIGLFKILSEESVAKGVRRITAVTGSEAVKVVQDLDAVVKQASAVLRVPAEQIPERVEAMVREIKELRKRPAAAAAGSAGFDKAGEVDTPHGKVLVGTSGLADAGAMRGLCDQHRQKGAAAMLVGAADGEKVTLVAMVSEEMVQATGLKAGDWVKQAAQVVGGGGGGKPTMAQAGGKQPDKLPDALAEAIKFVENTVG